jgi:hypothetical protein
VLLEGAERCRIEDNHFLNIGGNAVYLKGPSARNLIRRNEISRTGACGVSLAGKQARAQYPVFNEVVHNRIHHTGVLNTYSAGVFLGLSEGNVIGHNAIHDVPHHAVNLGNSGRSRNIIEYNEIRDTCLETSDTGAINCWMEETEKTAMRQGHIIRCNLVVDSRGHGIYVDNYTSNCLLYGNVIVRPASGYGILVNSGKNNVVENNVIVDAGTAIAIGSWNDSFDWLVPQMRGFQMGNRFCRNIVFGAKAKEPVVMAGPNWTPRSVAQVDYNLIFNAPNAESYLRDWRKSGLETHSLIADPLFVDPAHGNYRLKPESPAFQLGFQAIDFARIGPGSNQ